VRATVVDAAAAQLMTIYACQNVSCTLTRPT